MFVLLNPAPLVAAQQISSGNNNLGQFQVFTLYGGGTFDVSVLDVGDGVVEVRATNGDTHLGGDDWDAVLTEYIADEFEKVQGIDLRKDRQALQRLRESTEKAKIELSSILETEVNLPFITADASGPQHLQIKITRAKFEQLSAPLVQRCRGPFEAAGRPVYATRFGRTGTRRRCDPHADDPAARA